MSFRALTQRLGLGRQALDITHGRLRDNIWQLSWPLMISSGLSFFPGLYDAYWLGRLGPYALGAATLAISLRITLISVLMALSGASATVISRFVGHTIMSWRTGPRRSRWSCLSSHQAA